MPSFEPKEEKIPVTSLADERRSPHITRVTGKSRLYRVLDHKVPSVTSVLSTVYPKPALVGWAKKISREAYGSYLEDHMGEPITPDIIAKGMESAKGAEKDTTARDYGTTVHELISRDVQGKRIEVASEFADTIEAWREWRSLFKLKLIDSEVAVYLIGGAQHMRYAGTVDLIFKRPNGRYLISDIKTSKAVYPEALLQLVAYAGALKWLAPHPIEVDMEVLRLGKDKKNKPEFEVVSVTNAAKLWETWAAALRFHYEYEGEQ